MELTESTGNLVLYVGDELATDDDRSAKDQLRRASQRGNLVVGVIGAENPGEAQQIPTEAQLHRAVQAPTDRPWWKRLFNH